MQYIDWLDRLILAHPSSLEEWPTVLRDLWALPRHKGEASLVKSPFFATHKSIMHLQERYLVQANLGGYATTFNIVRGDDVGNVQYCIVSYEKYYLQVLGTVIKPKSMYVFLRI